MLYVRGSLEQTPTLPWDSEAWSLQERPTAIFFSRIYIPKMSVGIFVGNIVITISEKIHPYISTVNTIPSSHDILRFQLQNLTQFALSLLASDIREASCS